MKKLYSCFLIILIFSSSLFCFSWFDDRFFEVAIDMPFGISNNTLQIGNIFTKNLVIDFKDLATRVPDDGLSFYSYSNPSLSFNLNFRKFQLGFKSGVDSWANTSISKELFEYIGNGNELYETVSVSQKSKIELVCEQQSLLSLSEEELLELL